MYFEELADTGLIGFSFFMAIAVTSVRTLVWVRRRWAQKFPDLVYVATGFLLALVVYLADGIFEQLAFERYYWLLLALSSVAVQTTQSEALRCEAFAHDSP